MPYTNLQLVPLSSSRRPDPPAIHGIGTLPWEALAGRGRLSSPVGPVGMLESAQRRNGQLKTFSCQAVSIDVSIGSILRFWSILKICHICSCYETIIHQLSAIFHHFPFISEYVFGPKKLITNMDQTCDAEGFGVLMGPLETMSIGRTWWCPKNWDWGFSHGLTMFNGLTDPILILFPFHKQPQRFWFCHFLEVHPVNHG